MVDPRGLNHPIAHEEIIDGREVGVYRASAVGHCEWALLAARMGMEPAAPPAAMQQVFSEGHDNEETILRLFYEKNRYLSPMKWTKECAIWIGANIVIRGHVDDLAEHAPNQIYLLEAKAVGKSLWQQLIKAIGDLPEGEFVNGDSLFAEGGLVDLWQKYRDQLEVYMAATGATQAALIVGQKPERVEGEEQRGLVENIEWIWVTPDPARLARIKAKIAIVENRSRGGVSLPAECEQQMYPCPYYYLLHSQKEKPKPIVIEDDELAAAMAEYQQAGLDEKSAKGRRDAAKITLDRFFGHGDDAETSKQLAASVGEEPELRVIAPGIPVVSGEWTATYVERNMPGGTYTRKATVQKFYQIKRKVD